MRSPYFTYTRPTAAVRGEREAVLDLYPRGSVQALPAGRGIPLRARDGSVRAWARVDDEDFERVNAHRWCLADNGYAMRQEPLGGGVYRWVRMHRFVLADELVDGLEIDHINGDKLDNRRANLRQVSHALNAQNLVGGRGTTSPHRGVRFRSDLGRWQATMMVAGKRHWLGCFDTEAEAAEAAAAARAEHMPGSIEAHRARAPRS